MHHLCPLFAPSNAVRKGCGFVFSGEFCVSNELPIVLLKLISNCWAITKGKWPPSIDLKNIYIKRLNSLLLCEWHFRCGLPHNRPLCISWITSHLCQHKSRLQWQLLLFTPASVQSEANSPAAPSCRSRKLCSFATWSFLLWSCRATASAGVYLLWCPDFNLNQLRRHSPFPHSLHTLPHFSKLWSSTGHILCAAKSVPWKSNREIQKI